MLEEKINNTIDNFKQIEVLEDIILNPEKKIEDIIKEKEIFFNGNYTELLISLSQFLINKDQTISKDVHNESEKFKNWLCNKYIENYTNVDDMSLDQFIDQINIIRNNIAHGKYIIDKNTLNLKFGDTEIPYIWIRDIIEDLFVNNKNKLKKLPLKTGYIHRINENDIQINNIDGVLSNYSVIEYNLNAQSENFNENVLEFIHQEIENDKNNVNNILLDKEENELFKRRMDNFKRVASVSHIDLNVDIFSMKDIPIEHKNKINEIINNNYEKLNNQPPEILDIFFKGIMEDLYFDKDDYLQIDKALSQIKRLSILAQLNKNMNYNDLKSSKRCLPPTDNQMLLATTLTKFNVLYSYNNDDILKEYLDFSKLDFSGLTPTINEDVTKGLVSNEERKILSLNRENRATMRRYENLSRIPNPRPEQVEMITNTNLKIYEGLFDILEQQSIMDKKRFAENDKVDNKEEYLNNKSIITHLRNSITHGHIKINSRIVNNDLRTCSITFEDFDQKNNKKTFELTTTLDKIAQISNYNEIKNILKNNDNYLGRSFSGFTSLLVLTLVISLEAIGLLFYAFLKFGIFFN